MKWINVDSQIAFFAIQSLPSIPKLRLKHETFEFSSGSNEIMTFLISFFFAIEISSRSSADSFLSSKLFFSSEDEKNVFILCLSVEIFPALGIECIWRWLDVCDGILCCLLCFCHDCWVVFSLALYFRFKGEENLMFYVFTLRNFIVFNNHLEKILFCFLWAAVWGK